MFRESLIYFDVLIICVNGIEIPKVSFSMNYVISCIAQHHRTKIGNKQSRA